MHQSRHSSLCGHEQCLGSAGSVQPISITIRLTFPHFTAISRSSSDGFRNTPLGILQGLKKPLYFAPNFLFHFPLLVPLFVNAENAILMFLSGLTEVTHFFHLESTMHHMNVITFLFHLVSLYLITVQNMMASSMLLTQSLNQLGSGSIQVLRSI